ncbi:MAG TPA: right-handed parallel beta-helix repeat-containing protein [Pyrinomonadaceae bacterium]|nr:right-handed parallel beta-helix repeat-containing protein [Pyrinomonadaceae bacterium]
MTRLGQSALRLLFPFIATLLFTTAASAIPQTFVSSFGNNANTCERSAPCSTFAGALAKTNANGEVSVLDSGEYGGFSINKAIRITAVGVYAGISSEIYISVPETEVTVLRGLTIAGRGESEVAGINHFGRGFLLIEDCTISGWGDSGIWVHNAGRLSVKDTSIRNNRYYGIYINPGWTPTSPFGSGTVIALIDHCQIEQNGTGLVFITLNSAFVKATIRDSVISNNNGPGCAASSLAEEGGSPATEVNIFNSEAVNNSGAGFQISGAGAKLNARHSLSSNNGGAGFSAAGGGVLSATDCTAANNSIGMLSSQSGVLSVKGCQLVNNRNYGVNVSDGAVALVSATMAAGNQFGLRNDPSSPGTLKSFGNNRVNGNTTNTAGTVTTVSQM